MCKPSQRAGRAGKAPGTCVFDMSATPAPTWSRARPRGGRGDWFYFLQDFLYGNITSYQHQTLSPSRQKLNNAFGNSLWCPLRCSESRAGNLGGERASAGAGSCLSWRELHASPARSILGTACCSSCFHPRQQAASAAQ